ncbi:Bacterial PH domain protein [Candidatus Gugararchaeum adminiculabundum]|nr:Bacterial PH domain protein [Candidatus Gugararchaeum adminiculabundum]
MAGNEEKSMVSFCIDSNVRLAWLAPFAVVFALIWILGIVAVLSFPTIVIGDSEMTRTGLIGTLLGLTALVLGPVFAFYHMTYATYSYELHKDAIVIRKGIVAKHRVVIPYEKMVNINSERGVFESLFGLSTVKIDTGTGKEMLEGSIPGVRNREQLVSELLSRKQKKNAAKEEATKVDNPQANQINLLKEILEEMKQLRILLSEKKTKKSFDEMSEMHEHEAFIGSSDAEEERPINRRRK